MRPDEIFYINNELGSKYYSIVNLPDFAVECSLAKVQPNNETRKWSKKAIDFMKDYCFKIMTAKV